MLDNTNNTVTTTTEQIDGLATKIKNLGTTLAESTVNFNKNIEKGVNAASNFETKLYSAARGLGQGVAFAKRLEDNLGKAATQVLNMGGDLDDVIDSYKSINEALERTTFLTNKTLINIAAVSKFGVGSDTITTIAKFFDKVGGGMESAVESTIELTQTAQKYGLNAGAFVKEVAGQMDKLNRYGFPKGVEDLASMVAKSKMLGDTLSVAQNFADQIMESPEKAYEYAAGLQTLGGSFAQLGDGAQLLYMAQNDLNGLQEQIVKATKGIATFNEETGQFQISTQERLRLRQLKNFSLDADKIEETALKLAKQEKIIQQLNLNPEIRQMSKEDKETLANYAQLSKGGTVTIEGKEVGAAGQDLNKILKTLQGAGAQLSTDAGKNIDTVQANMSATERVTLSLNKLNNVYATALLNTQNFSESLAKLSNVAKEPARIAESGTSSLAGKVKTSFDDFTTTISAAVTSATTAVETVIKNLVTAGNGTYTSATGKGVAEQVTVDGSVKLKIEGFDLKLADTIVNELETYITNKVKNELDKKSKYMGSM